MTPTAEHRTGAPASRLIVINGARAHSEIRGEDRRGIARQRSGRQGQVARRTCATCAPLAPRRAMRPRLAASLAAALAILASITIICLQPTSSEKAAAKWRRHHNNRSAPEQPAIATPPARARRSPQPPKLVQWTREAVHYHEGSTLVLSCSLASSPAAGSKLKFAWFKQGKPIGGAGGSSSAGRLTIETLPDYSFLRLVELRPADSGAYTCAASNGLGQEDRTTTQVVVNVRLKWLAPSGGEPPELANKSHELLTVRAGQQVAFECAAAAQPAPRIRWFRLVPAAGRLRSPAQESGRQARGWQRLDEPAIRSALLQVDALGEPANMHKLEIGSKASAQQMDDNETMRWRVETSTGSSQHEIHSRLLLDKADANQVGLFECEAAAAGELELPANELATGQLAGSLSTGSAAAGGDKLRRLFGLLVNGKY